MLKLKQYGRLEGVFEVPPHVVIKGVVNGPVYARVMLELQPKARIQVHVHYTALEMYQGALIAGQLRPILVSKEDVREGKPTLKLATNSG